jgi:hypothetical protein
MNWDASLFEQVFAGFITEAELLAMFEPIEMEQLFELLQGGQDEPN